MIKYRATDSFRILFQLKGSVLPRILPRVLLCAGLGVVATYLHHTHHIYIPCMTHTLLGVALGLLLVFRTNTSYDRFWEGRKLFGAIVNRSRDIVRQAAVYIEGDSPEDERARQEVRRLVVVLFVTLCQFLRNERSTEVLSQRLVEAGAPISEEERAAIESAEVWPTVVVYWLTHTIEVSRRVGRLTEDKLKLMDNNVSLLIDSWGGAERILRTPIPFAYAQHIRVFVALFCFTAPFALVDAMQWVTPIAAAILAFGMFGIDAIGVEIEDPFGDDPNDLPLESIGARLAEDTRVLLLQRSRGRGTADVSARFFTIPARRRP
jgi:ion channel-forming bestrophin family protein